MKRFQWLILPLLLTTLPACAQDQPHLASAVATPSSTANATVTQPSNKEQLAGTAWKLVKLQTADETTHVPDDPSKYTIRFGKNGRVSSRVDCNSATSTWKSPRAGELHFGSWSRTSNKCPAGSLHDKIVTEGANVRSYSIKDGHLFLTGMAAGGFYELEPHTTPE